MRPEALELEGFTAFRDRTRIEFGDADLVAFTGPTGAGKSSLIDAMIFALYGRTPRLGAGAVAPVISQGRAEARVRLDFVADGRRYTAARVVRQTPSGTVSTKEARLERAEDGEPLARNVGELNGEIERLIGLDFEQFTTCVALPQGEFAQFLKEAPAKRQELLTRLLGLGVYRRMGQRAHELHSTGEGTIALRERDLDALTDATAATVAEREARLTALQTLRPRVASLVDRLSEFDLAIDRTNADRRQAASRIAALSAIRTPPAMAALSEDMVAVRRRTDAAVEHLRNADVAVSDTEKALADLGDVAELQRIRSEYERLATLAAKADATKVEADRARVRAAEAAAQLEAADKALAKANEARDEAGREARGLTPDGLRIRIDSLRRVVPPGDIDAIGVESRSADERLRKAIVDREEAEKRETAAIENLRRMNTPRDAATLRGLRQDHEALQRLEGEAANASNEADSARGELRENEGRAAAASRTLAQVRIELEAMRRRHAAHELRVTLAPGEPCPVCEQDVATVPATEPPTALATLREAEAEADEAHRQAERARNDARAKSSVADARLDDTAGQAEAVRGRLESAPLLDDVNAAIDAIANAETHLQDVRQRLASCRREEESARRTVESLGNRVGEAWRIHDRLRDDLAALAPPAADRDDPASSWRSLAAWAARMRDDLQGGPG